MWGIIFLVRVFIVNKKVKLQHKALARVVDKLLLLVVKVEDLKVELKSFNKKWGVSFITCSGEVTSGEITKVSEVSEVSEGEEG
jgi:hypothetical protein